MDQRARNVEHLMRGANSLLQCLAVESAAADVSRRKAQMDGQTVGQTVGQPVSRCTMVCVCIVRRSVRYALCDMHYAICTMRYALFDMHCTCAICTVLPVRTVLSTLCGILSLHTSCGVAQCYYTCACYTSVC
jgi:hypothetical protein